MAAHAPWSPEAIAHAVATCTKASNPFANVGADLADTLCKRKEYATVYYLVRLLVGGLSRLADPHGVRERTDLERLAPLMMFPEECDADTIARCAGRKFPEMDALVVVLSEPLGLRAYPEHDRHCFNRAFRLMTGRETASFFWGFVAAAWACPDSWLPAVPCEGLAPIAERWAAPSVGVRVYGLNPSAIPKTLAGDQQAATGEMPAWRQLELVVTRACRVDLYTGVLAALDARDEPVPADDKYRRRVEADLRTARHAVRRLLVAREGLRDGGGVKPVDAAQAGRW